MSYNNWVRFHHHGQDLVEVLKVEERTSEITKWIPLHRVYLLLLLFYLSATNITFEGCSKNNPWILGTILTIVFWRSSLLWVAQLNIIQMAELSCSTFEKKHIEWLLSQYHHLGVETGVLTPDLLVFILNSVFLYKLPFPISIPSSIRWGVAMRLLW